MRRQGLVSENNRIRPVVYGVCLYFWVSGMDSFNIGTATSVLKIVAFVPIALSLLDIKRWRMRFSSTFVLQMLFWLLTIVSVLYSVNPSKSVSSVKPLTLNLALIICLGVMESYNARELQLMKRALLAGGWVTILLMLIFSDTSADGRLTLLIGKDNQDQNYINGYFLYAFSYHCSKMFLEKKKKHIVPTYIILAVMLLTGSRGALIAFMFVIFVHACIMFANSKHRARNILLVVSVMAISLVAFDLILTQMPESVAQRFSWDYIAEKGTTGRTNVWRFLLGHFSQDSVLRILFGHGYGTTKLVNTMNGAVAHNLYVDNLITLGIIGVSLQIIIQMSVVRVLFKHRQYPLLGAYLGMLCMCLSLSLVTYKPIWNIMLLALAINANPASAKNLNHEEKQEVQL